jgi:hypothetical protein
MTERDMKGECWGCKFKMEIPGNCHIQCIRFDKYMTGNAHGIKMGWFFYPWVFDPVWKTSLCRNYEPKEVKQS